MTGHRIIGASIFVYESTTDDEVRRLMIVTDFIIKRKGKKIDIELLKKGSDKYFLYIF